MKKKAQGKEEEDSAMSRGVLRRRYTQSTGSQDRIKEVVVPSRQAFCFILAIMGSPCSKQHMVRNKVFK